jgi:hypothetical protein
VAYGVAAIFINPRFILPFEDRPNSASLFVSPGIGISQLGIGDSDITIMDDARFTWQIKSGISFPVSHKVELFGQLRYVSQAEEFTVDFFGTEIGVNLKL